MKLRILHLIETLGPGGAERLLITMLRCMDKDKFSNAVCYLCNIKKENAFLLDDLNRIGVKTYSLNMDKIKFSISAMAKLIQIIKHENIDIVHTHLFGANIYGRIAGRIAGVPCIISTLHNLDYNPYFSFRNRLFFERRRLLDKFTGKFCNSSFISVSEAVKRSAEKFLGFRNIRVIHNSIDLDRFRPLNRDERMAARNRLNLSMDEIVLVSVGRIVLQKGHIFLLRALSDERLRGRNIKLLLVGAWLEPLKKSLEGEVERLKLQGKVIFMGSRKDVREIVGCSDIFVLSSIYEGFGIALLEAMALKIPCVASNVDGIREIIINGKNGILAEPCSAQALAEGILELLGDPVKRSDIAEAGCVNVQQNFDIKHQVKFVEGVYLNGSR